MPYHFIYKTTNKQTGKFYVGMHTTRNLDDGYLGSGKILKRSIKKYGIEKHHFEILEFFETRELLVEREKQILTEEFISDPLCMNIRLGGEGGGGWTSEQQRENSRKSNQRQQTLKEECPDWWNTRNKRIGKSISKQHKDSLRDMSPLCTFSGKNHSEETRKKISETRKGTIMGSDNPSYGKKWYYSEKLRKNIKCFPEDVPEGYVPGRKMKF